jgi:hypothetical protein
MNLIYSALSRRLSHTTESSLLWKVQVIDRPEDLAVCYVDLLSGNPGCFPLLCE